MFLNIQYEQKILELRLKKYLPSVPSVFTCSKRTLVRETTTMYHLQTLQPSWKTYIPSVPDETSLSTLSSTFSTR